MHMRGRRGREVIGIVGQCWEVIKRISEKPLNIVKCLPSSSVFTYFCGFFQTNEVENGAEREEKKGIYSFIAREDIKLLKCGWEVIENG